MPIVCNKCGRVAPCVSAQGLRDVGWRADGPFFHGGMICERCVAQKQADQLLAAMEKTMTVRAKVTCESIEGNAVSFHTVCETDDQKGADPENVRFTKATPWGNLRLGIDNPVALEQFQVGKCYYVDFTPAG